MELRKLAVSPLADVCCILEIEVAVSGVDAVMLLLVLLVLPNLPLLPLLVEILFFCLFRFNMFSSKLFI